MNGGLVSLAIYILLTGAMIRLGLRAYRAGTWPIRPDHLVRMSPAGEIWLTVQAVALFIAANMVFPVLIACGILTPDGI